MAWDLYGDDLYSGDAPMDAFGIGLAKAAAAWTVATKRKPYASELAEALLAALVAAPDNAVTRREAASKLLGRWLALPRTNGKQRPKAAVGDVVRIPYAGDGARQIYARVLLAGDTDADLDPNHLSLAGGSTCFTIVDLDAPATGELAIEAIVRCPILAGPFLGGDDEIRAGRWRIVGNAPLAAIERPVFRDRIRDRTGTLRMAVVDHLRTEVADPAAPHAMEQNEPRPEIGDIVAAIRMLRGCVHPRLATLTLVRARRAP